MTRTTDTTTGVQRDENADDGSDAALTRRAMLAGTGTALLAMGAGTASADPTGQVGTGGRPVERLFTAAIAGGLTDGAEVTDLAGDGLSVDGESLSAADARLTVTDGETTVENVEAISFDGANSIVETDAGVTVDK